jgi:hypothetical protein
MRSTIQIIERELALASRRQFANGGFSPTRRTDNQNHARTYSTIMALWLLIEARKNEAIPSTRARAYDDKIRKGIGWLANAHKTKQNGVGGWWPTPEPSSLQDEFLGLTAQTLYILSRAESEFEAVRLNSKVQQATANFMAVATRGVGGVGPLSNLEMKANQRAHDSDRYLPGLPEVNVESSTFLWYPWTLVLSLQLAGTRSSEISAQAYNLVNTLVRRSDEFGRFAEADPALYPTAEGLFAIGLYLRSYPRKP